MPEMTSERVKYNELIEKFKTYLRNNCLIYDIGKSDIWDYRNTLYGYYYKTIDKLKTKEPDIIFDLEYDNILLPQADAILLNGVTEQCDNPFRLLEVTDKILKPYGVMLVGICSVSYPIGEWDYLRFTPKGAEHLLRNYRILHKEILYRNDIPSYTFFIVQKK